MDLLTGSLSDEVLLLIISNLNLEAVINLSQTCTKFDNLIKDKSICKDLHYDWSCRLDRLTFIRFLKNIDRAAVITKLNLNDVYWVPSGVIKDITKPLVNLKEFHVAGTHLSWKHLLEILSPSKNLIALSFSWDNRAESMNRRFGLAKLVPDTPNPNDVVIIQSSLERLNFLLIHIPMIQNSHSASYTYHPGLTYFVSMCTNLEHLWILSWSKTDAERKLIEIFGEENFVENVNFPRLKTFTLRAHPRLYTPKLVHAMVNNMEKNGNGCNISHFWVDHPLLNGSWISFHSVDRISGSFSQASQQWPKLNINSVERLSLPLIEKSTDWLTGNSFEKVKFLQITDGLPRIVNLNGLFDMAHDLESISMKAINVKLEWNRFVETHPKLREVNVCQDDHFPYPDICVALSKMTTNLKKLSLPLFALIEIKNSSIVDKYHQTASSSMNETVVPQKSRVETMSTEFGKKKRISYTLLNKNQSPKEAISGLDLITHACPAVEEFELGFSKVTRPGVLITNSLVNISRWKHLVKLTIENAPVHEGQFLVQIAKSCKLRSLRLKTLGNRARCTYIQDLCTALTMMTQLRDFRLEQNYIGSTSRLFSSLQYCSKLQRFLLWCPMNEQPLDQQSCLTLMAECKDLMMLYLTVGATTKRDCDGIRKAIESQYKKCRPALSVVIRRGHSDVIEDAALPIIYPSVHYRQMVGFYTEIGQQTHFNVR